MKKGITIIICATLMSITSAMAQNIDIDAINFPDANFRAYLLAQPYGSDDILTPAEIAGITNISVSYLNISDLTGIEFFTALQNLACYYNQITSLDVSGFTALQNLWCHNNQLTSLDISNNTALQGLFCSNNQITSLDVSGFTALLDFRCFDNQLTSLDVSGCTALQFLNCHTNQLTSLDVSGCTALQELYCSINQLTSLDVSNNTALQYLQCHENQLTSLDVSGCTALESLSCRINQLTSLDVSECTALEYLYCRNNQLTSLDVSNNTALQELYCYNNRLPLSDLYSASTMIAIQDDKQFGFQQLSPVSATVGAIVDWSPLPAQNVFNGIYTTYDVRTGSSYTGPVASPSDYTVSNGNITFNTAGTYTVIMKNAAITCNASPELQVVATITASGEGGGDEPPVSGDDCMEVKWAKNFGGSAWDYYQSVTAVSDGIVAVGYSQAGSFGNGDLTDITGKGGNDGIIVKYNNAGNIVWKKNFGGSAWDYYYGVTTVSDGFVAVGLSNENSFNNGDWTGVTGKGYNDAIIVKYDNSGNVVWKKNFGGSDNELYSSVTAVSDGIVAVGQSYEYSFNNGDWTGVTGNGYYDAIIVKYDNSGNVLWKKNFGGNGTDRYNYVTAVSDGIVVVGFSLESSFGSDDWADITGKGVNDAIIVKYDNSGNVLWKKNFGGSGWDGYQFLTVVSDGLVAVGYAQEDTFGTGDWTGVTGKGESDAIIVKYACDSEPIEDCEPVTNILNLPSCTSIGNMALIGMITPTNATNQNIVWSVTGAGASISGTNNDILTTTSTGSVTVRATISNGLCGSDYTQDFNITVIEAVTDINYTPGTISRGNPLALGYGLTLTPGTVTDYSITWSVVNASTTGAGITGNILKVTSFGTLTVRAHVINNTCGNVIFTKDYPITVNGGCCY